MCHKLMGNKKSGKPKNLKKDQVISFLFKTRTNCSRKVREIEFIISLNSFGQEEI